MTLKCRVSGFCKQFYVFGLLFALWFLNCSQDREEQQSLREIENHTFFEKSSIWQPDLDLQTDLVLIRFDSDTSQFFQIARSWQKQNYNVGVIFSINQSQIFDSPEREKLENQVTNFLNKGYKTIVLEEPAFNFKEGYSQEFQNYWKNETGTNWTEPADSADIWYRAAKVKQKSFIDFFEALTATIKDFASAAGKQIDIYISSEGSLVSTHLNNIISGNTIFKYSSIDGVIGKKATNNLPFVYQKKTQKYPFPVSYFNASWFFNSVDQVKKHLFLPIFFQNQNLFSEQLVANLMQPSVKQFQFGPDLSDLSQSQKFQFGLFTFITESLRDISSEKINWSHNPWPKTGIIFSDTYMFGRGGEMPCELESFYQHAMPFLERGVPVQVVPLERVVDETYLNQFDVLYMTYESYKPNAPDLHNYLEKWVRRKGGVLFFYMGSTSEFDEIEEWWAENYDRPHEHLFELLKTGLNPESGMHKVGRGIVYTERNSPKELAKTPRGGEIIWNTYTEILMSYVQMDTTILETKNRLYLERGPYHLIYVPEEIDSFSVSGNFIDLFSENLTIVDDVKFNPNEVGLLLNIDYFAKDSSAIVFSSSKILNIISDQSFLEFSSYWLQESPNITYIRLSSRPEEIICQDDQGVNIAINQNWISDKNILKLETISRGSSLRFKIKK